MRKSRRKREGSLERGNFSVALKIKHGPVSSVTKKAPKQMESDPLKSPPGSMLPPNSIPLASSSTSVSLTRLKEFPKLPPPSTFVRPQSIRSRAVRHSVCVVSTPALPPMTHCDVCSQPGHITNLVRCDECSKVYHFKCLEPPLNRNPKKRGYSWHCAECDPTDLDDN